MRKITKGISPGSALRSWLSHFVALWYSRRGGNLRWTGEDRKEGLLYLLGIVVESKLLTLKIIVAYHLNVLIFSRQFGPDWSYFILINKPADTLLWNSLGWRGSHVCGDLEGGFRFRASCLEMLLYFACLFILALDSAYPLSPNRNWLFFWLDTWVICEVFYSTIGNFPVEKAQVEGCGRECPDFSFYFDFNLVISEERRT